MWKIRTAALAIGVAIMLPPVAAAAKVVKQDEAGFVTRDTRTVEASPRDAWMALISPGKWWSGSHTWSGDAANLTITPQAGGCFCERIPEVETRDKIGLAGSAQHMVVVYAAPDEALRMRGSLGPLQGEAATGVLTIALDEVEHGTAITFEYVVGGYTRYEIAAIAKAVDGVMSQQLAGLAALLGAVETPADADAAEDTGADAGDAPTPEEEAEMPPEEKPSVDDAFSDLAGGN